MQPAGRDLGAPLAPEINGQYRSNGARMGSNGARMPVLFVAQRHSIAELPRRTHSRDTVDSDCVLGTQLESSQPHHSLSV